MQTERGEERNREVATEETRMEENEIQTLRE